MNDTNAPNLEIRLAVPEDYPALAQLLADNFQGKFAIALGRDPVARARRMETLLPFGVLCPGHVYVGWLEDSLVGSFTLKTAERTPTADDFQKARQALQETDGWWRALWATAILRQFTGPKLEVNDIYIDNLVTSKAVQRRGLGAHMAHATYEVGREMGKSVIWADIMSSNYRVIGLYKKEGWEVVSRNYWVAPLLWPLVGTPGLVRIRKELTSSLD